MGTHPNRLAANRRWNCRIPPGPRILDDSAWTSILGAGRAVPAAADITGIDMARAQMAAMETSDLDGKLAFILAISVMNARGVHLDQHQTSCLNAIFKPMLEVLGPMRLELTFVSN